MTEYTPTVGELRQAYVEASGASMAQEMYYAEQVAEFERGLARIKAEVILMDGFDMAVADSLADAGYTEYAEDEDGGVTWVSAPLGDVLHIVRVCATEYETGDRA